MAEDKGALHRAVLGSASPQQLEGWLDRHVRGHLNAAVDSVRFQAGDIGAVFGVGLADGREVVVKALRGGADLSRIRTVVRCQSLLAARGFGCAQVIDGPSVTEGVVAIVEQQLPCTPTGDPHQHGAIDAMAAALAWQIDLLRDGDGGTLVRGRPAWANWDAGAWPAPHDPVFDFASPIEGSGWIDEAADAAAAVLRGTARWSPVIGHSDWVWQNVCVRNGRFIAGYDWDSLVWAPESVVVGLSAGAFTQGSPQPPDAPSWDAVLRFIDAYETALGVAFGAAERRAVEAAARWVRCYNARCQVDNQVRRAWTPPQGSFIEQLAADLGRTAVVHPPET